MTRSIGPLCGLACIGSLVGCFSVDPDLIRDPDAGSESDAEAKEDASAAPQNDGEAEAEAEPDDSGPDASILLPCNDDAECTDGSYCSRATQRCQPACEEQRGCLMRGFDQPVSDLLALPNDEFLIVTQPGRDSLGNVRSDQAIWSWDLKDAPRKLSEGACFDLIHATADSIYCRDTLSSKRLLRISRSAPQQPEVLSATYALSDGVERAWRTPEHVWWTLRRGDMGEVWRVKVGATSAAELWQSQVGFSWLVGNEDHLAYTTAAKPGSPGAVYAWDLGRDQAGPDLHVAIAQGPSSVQVGADAQALYTTVYSDMTIRRTPFAGGQATLLSNVPTCSGTFLIEANFVYWQCTTASAGSSRLIVGRNRVDPPGEPEMLVNTLGPNGGTSYLSPAVLSRQLVYYNQLERRLFSLALP